MTRTGLLTGTDVNVAPLTGRAFVVQTVAGNNIIIPDTLSDAGVGVNDASTAATPAQVTYTHQTTTYSKPGSNLPLATPVEWGLIAVGVGLIALMAWSVWQVVKPK